MKTYEAIHFLILPAGKLTMSCVSESEPPGCSVQRAGPGVEILWQHGSGGTEGEIRLK